MRESMSEIPEDIVRLATDTLLSITGSEGGCPRVNWYLLRNRVASAIDAERRAEHERCNAIVKAAWGQNISLEAFEDGLSHIEERDRLREENRASKVLLESKDETIRQLTEERAEQWSQRRDAEGSRDAARAAADSLRIERDALREAMEGIVHFSDALNFRNDHLSKALSQWIEAGRKLLSPVTAEVREP
jgi:hypothetical protein